VHVVANWQTRMLQVMYSQGLWGFESPLLGTNTKFFNSLKNGFY